LKFRILNRSALSNYLTPKEISIKDVRSPGGLSSAGIFHTGRKGFFGCERPNFLVQNTMSFSKFMVCLRGQGGRGLSQGADILRTREKGQFFAIFYGRSLWMDPNKFRRRIEKTVIK